MANYKKMDKKWVTVGRLGAGANEEEFFERVVPACMQGEVMPQFHYKCAITASHVYNAADEGIAKGIHHPSHSTLLVFNCLLSALEMHV